MKIRKLFKFEAAHIVRNCSTERCKWNVHGHSFKVEVFLRCDTLDKGGMVMDFGLLKSNVKTLFDAFDHSYILWNYENSEVKDKIRFLSRRVVEVGFTPSAENLACYFHWMIQKILQHTEFANGEGKVEVASVRVHETDTGYAETEGFEQLVSRFSFFDKRDDIKFSEAIREDTDIDKVLDVVYSEDKVFKNPEVEQQYKV